MKKSVWLWLIAFLLTVFTAIYQRITGPTYPVSGEAMINEKLIEYKLDRSHSGESDLQIDIEVNDKNVSGKLFWKRFKTNDEWNSVEMQNEDGKLISTLPHQPPAGKLIYKIILEKENKKFVLPDEAGVIIRFKGEVPALILIPHIIFIFGAMFLSARAGLEYFNYGRNFKSLTIFTFVFIIIGGFILGPIVQYYAFGEFWTGFPFGYDLTDNKILIGFICWLIALIALYKSKNPGRWIIFSSLIMFIIFLIPHSLLGSELDYNELDKKNSVDQTKSFQSK
jgi:hypothetical protein